VPSNKSESIVQQEIRLAAPKHNMRLWRNNNGAVHTNDGRFIRFGLANESANMSKHIKSSDLIGITQHTIRPEDVGKTVGIITSIEVKHESWVYTGTSREIAQLAWIEMINQFGGFATFATSPNDIAKVKL
jgi:hypothetical protein